MRAAEEVAIAAIVVSRTAAGPKVVHICFRIEAESLAPVWSRKAAYVSRTQQAIDRMLTDWPAKATARTLALAIISKGWEMSKI